MSASVSTKTKNHGSKYLRRAADIFGSAIGDYFSEAMPTTSSIASDSKAIAHDVAATFNEARSKVVPTVRQIKTQFGFKAITNWFLGESAEFDDSDPAAGLSFDGVETSSEIAEIQTSESERNTNKLAKAVVDSSHQMVNANAQLAGTMLTSIENTAKLITSGFDSTNKLLSQLLEVVTKNTASLVESTAAMVAEGSSKIDENPGHKMFMDGRFSLSDYTKVIRENIHEEFKELDMVIQMADMFKDAAKDPAAIGSMLFGGAMEKFAPVLDKNIRELDKTLNEAILNGIAGLAVNPKNGKPGVLARLFGIKGLDEKGADTSRSKLELKEAKFDTITKEAITNAIPGYLKHILVAVGGPELEYDYRSRSFRTKSSLRKEFQDNTHGRGNTLGSASSKMKSLLNDPSLNGAGELFHDLMINELGRRDNYQDDLKKLTDPNAVRKLFEALSSGYDLGDKKNQINKVAGMLASVLQDPGELSKLSRQVSRAHGNRLRDSKKYISEANAYNIDLSGFVDDLGSSNEGIMRAHGISKKTSQQISSKQSQPTAVQTLDYTNRALYEIYRRLDTGLNVYVTGRSKSSRKKPYETYGDKYLQAPPSYNPKGMSNSGTDDSKIDTSTALNGANVNIKDPEEIRYGEGGFLGDAAKYTGAKAKEFGAAMLHGSPEEVSSVVNGIVGDIVDSAHGRITEGIDKINDSFGNISGHIKHKIFGTAYSYTDTDENGNPIKVNVKENKGILGFLSDNIKDSVIRAKDAGVGWAKQMASKFDFGGNDQDKESKGMAGKRKQFLGAAVGAFAGAGILGGPLGILVGSIAGNALATHDIGKKLKDKLFGYDDGEDGDGRPTGIISKLGEKILTPIEFVGMKLVTKGADFMERHIFDPLSNIGIAIHDKITNSVDSLKSIVGGWLKEHVFSPIGKGIKTVAKYTIGLPITVTKAVMKKVPELIDSAKEHLKESAFGQAVLSGAARVRNFVIKHTPRALFSQFIAGGNSYHKLKKGEHYPLRFGQHFYDPNGEGDAKSRGRVHRLTEEVARDAGRAWVKIEEIGVRGEKYSYGPGPFSYGVMLNGDNPNEWRPRTKDYLKWSAQQKEIERRSRPKAMKYGDFLQNKHTRGKAFRNGLRGATTEQIQADTVAATEEVAAATEHVAEVTEKMADEQAKISENTSKITGEIIPGSSFKTHDQGVHNRLDRILDAISGMGGSKENHTPGTTSTGMELVATKLQRKREETNEADEGFANELIGAAATVSGSGGVFSKEEGQVTTDIVNEAAKPKTSKSGIIAKFKSLLDIQKDKSTEDGDKRESPLSKIFSFFGNAFSGITSKISSGFDWITGKIPGGGIIKALGLGLAGFFGYTEFKGFWDNVIKGDMKFSEWFSEVSTIGSAISNVTERVTSAINDDGSFSFMKLFDENSLTYKVLTWVNDSFSKLYDNVVDENGKISIEKITDPDTSIGGFLADLGSATRPLADVASTFAGAVGGLINNIASVTGVNLPTFPTSFNDTFGGHLAAGILSSAYMSAIGAAGSLLGGGGGGGFVSTALSLGGKMYKAATGGGSAASGGGGAATRGGGAGRAVANLEGAATVAGTMQLYKNISNGGTDTYEETDAAGNEVTNIDKTRAGYDVVTRKPVHAVLRKTLNDATGKTAAQQAQKSATKMLGGAPGENGGKNGLVQKGIGFVKKALEALKNWLKKSPKLSKALDVVGDAVSNIDGWIKKITSLPQKLLKKAADKIVQIVTRGTVQEANGVVTAGLGYLAMGIVGAVSGAALAANLFQCREKDVTAGMRATASILSAAFNAIPFGWAIEILDIFIDPLSVRSVLAQILYRAFGGEEAAAHLAESQAKLQGDVAAYNEKFGTNMSVAEYNDMINKGLGSKILVGGTTTDEEGRAKFTDDGAVLQQGGIKSIYTGSDIVHVKDEKGDVVKVNGKSIIARDKYGHEIKNDKRRGDYVGDFFQDAAGFLFGRDVLATDKNDISTINAETGEYNIDHHEKGLVENLKDNVLGLFGVKPKDGSEPTSLKDATFGFIKNLAGSATRSIGGFLGIKKDETGIQTEEKAEKNITDAIGASLSVIGSAGTKANQTAKVSNVADALTSGIQAIAIGALNPLKDAAAAVSDSNSTQYEAGADGKAIKVTNVDGSDSYLEKGGIGNYTASTLGGIVGSALDPISSMAQGVNLWEKTTPWAKAGYKTAGEWAAKQLNTFWNPITSGISSLPTSSSSFTRGYNTAGQYINSRSDLLAGNLWSNASMNRRGSTVTTARRVGTQTDADMDRIDKLVDSKARNTPQVNRFRGIGAMKATEDSGGGFSPTSAILQLGPTLGYNAGMTAKNRVVGGNPLSKPYTVTSPYGPRDLDGFHKGIDLVPNDSSGDAEIGSRYNATIRYVDKSVPDSLTGDAGANSDHSGGNMVIMDTDPFPDPATGKLHSHRIKFMHMKAGSIPSNIQEGAAVKVGQKIGEMGETGWSYGKHLHYQIETDPNNGNSHTNPLPYISKGAQLNGFNDYGSGYDGEYGEGYEYDASSSEEGESKGWFAQIIDTFKGVGTKILDTLTGGLFSFGGSNDDADMMGAAGGKYASAQSFLKMVANEIGTHDDGNNKVKYNDWYWGDGTCGPSYPWCMAFVQWCFHQAGLDLECKTAGCGTFQSYYQEHYPNKVFKAGGSVMPQPGDIAIFGDHDHTGIIESVKSSSSVVTIEGNTSSNNQENGGWVQRKDTRDTPYFSYFIRAVDFASLEAAAALGNGLSAGAGVMGTGDTLNVPDQYGTVVTYEKENYGSGPTNGWDPSSYQGRLRKTAKSRGDFKVGSIYGNDNMSMISNRMMVATTESIGNKFPVAVGDLLDAQFADGDVWHLIKADSKGTENTIDAGGNAWGHNGGKAMIEKIYWDYSGSPHNDTKKLKKLVKVGKYNFGAMRASDEAAIARAIDANIRRDGNGKRTVRSDLGSMQKRPHPTFRNRYIETFNEYLPSEERRAGGPRTWRNQGSTIDSNGNKIFVNRVVKHKPAGIGGMSPNDPTSRIKIPALNTTRHTTPRSSTGVANSSYRATRVLPAASTNVTAIVGSTNPQSQSSGGTNLSGVVRLLERAVQELASINNNTSDSASSLVDLNNKDWVVDGGTTPSAETMNSLNRATRKIEATRRHITNGHNTRTISSLVRP